MEMLTPILNPLSSALACMDSHITDLSSIQMHILSLTQWSRRRRQNKCRRCPLVNISDTDNAAIALYIVVRLTFSRFYATSMGKQGKLEPPDTDYLPEQIARPFLPYTGSPCAWCAFCTSCPCRTFFSPWGYSPSCCIECVIEAMLKRWSRGASESSPTHTILPLSSFLIPGTDVRMRNYRHGIFRSTACSSTTSNEMSKSCLFL